MLNKKVESDGSIWRWIDRQAQVAEQKALEAIRIAEQEAYEAE